MPFVYDLSFAGIPFCLDGGTEIPSGDASPTARPYEQRGGILDEVNAILPFKYLKDFSIPSVYPGRNLGAINYPNEMGPYPNPDVRIGDWYYPPGAKKWSVFRGLATSSMVKAMLAACRNTAYGLRTQASLSVSGFLASGTATLDRSGYFSGYFSDYQSGSVQYPTINAYQYPTWISLAGTIPNLFKILAIPQGAGEKGVPYGVSTFLYMLPPRPLAELGGSFDGLYLVTLVDERYYWQNTPVRLPIQQGMTWNYLLNELAIVLGIILYTNSPIEAVYGKPELDSQLWTCQESAATLLDAVAANVGRTVVRRYDGTYVLYTPEESREIVRVNRGDDPALYYNLLPFSGNLTNPVTARSTVRTAGGDVFYSGTVLPAGSLWAFKNAVAPFQIVTAFPKYVVGDDPVPHFSNPRYQGQRRSTWYEESYGDTYNVVVPILSGGPYVSGLVGASEMFLHDTAKALFSGEVSLNSGTPLNASGLTALAMKMAQDFYTQQVGTGLDEVYPGTRRWEPEGVNDLVYSYSDQARGAFTRVMHPSWTQETVEYQHATPPMSGFTENPPGVGGPSVAQTWRDQFGLSGTFLGLSGTDSSISGYPLSGTWYQSGSVITTLNQTLLSGSYTASFTSINHFPTDHRWYGKVVPLKVTAGDASGVAVSTSGESEEVILFEGTSGGVAGIYSGGYVGIVQRGVNGTIQQEHSNLTPVFQTAPNVGYGISLVTHEKGQFVFPGGASSGGVSEVMVVPQLQTVRVLDGEGVSFSGLIHYSGRVSVYDGTQPTSGPWIPTDLVWVAERNSGVSLRSGQYYGGQFVGYSPSNPNGAVAAPVYATNLGGGEAETSDVLVQLTEKTYSDACPTYYGFRVLDLGDCDYSDAAWPASQAACLPIFHEQGIDLVVAPPPSPRKALPGTTASDSSAGIVAWSNTSAVGQDDTSYATCVLESSETTQYLKVTDLCFNLPDTTTSIDGITVLVNGHASGGSVSDVEAKLVVGGVITGSSASVGTDLNTSDSTKTYTFSTSLPTLSQVNADDFGFAVRYSNGSGAQRTAFINFIEVRVTFTPSSSGVVVSCVVRLRLGDDGTYYLMDHEPRWEYVEMDTTASPVTIDGVVYQPGWLLRYDQATKDFLTVEDVLVRDVSGLS